MLRALLDVETELHDIAVGAQRPLTISNRETSMSNTRAMDRPNAIIGRDNRLAMWSGRLQTHDLALLRVELVLRQNSCVKQVLQFLDGLDLLVERWLLTWSN